MSSFVSYDGTRLAYDLVGNGPLLLCLPGGPGRASAYLEDLGGLAKERTLVRLDARATGHSEVPADPASLRFDRLARDVEALRAHLAADGADVERIDLLAHSAGCLVAQVYAASSRSDCARWCSSRRATGCRAAAARTSRRFGGPARRSPGTPTPRRPTRP